MNIEVATNFDYVPLKITVLHECNLASLTQITSPPPPNTYTNTVLQPIISKNVNSAIPERLFTAT